MVGLLEGFRSDTKHEAPTTVVNQKDYWEAQHQRRACEHFDLENTPNQFAVSCAEVIPFGGRVVEIGPGNGRDARYFIRQKACTVLAVEIAQTAIDQLEQAAIRDGTWENVIPIVSCAQNLRAHDLGPVDAFYARSSLHLSDDELVGFVNLVDSTLRKGGYLMIEGKTPTDPKIGRSTLLSNNLYSDYDGHVRRAWTEESMRALVERKGYAIHDLGYNAETWGGTTAHFIHCIARK